MSKLLMDLTIFSLLGLLMISIYRFFKVKRLRSLLIQLIALTLCSWGVYAFFVAPGTPREASDEVYFVIILYGCMVLGMLAQYAHNRFTQPKEERKNVPFDLGLFLAPLFASPIIFLPLLAALQNALTNIKLAELTTAKLMMFFVAFENGFFWKDYFDHRQQQIKDQFKKESPEKLHG